MICNKCGKEISDQAKFCNYCGSQVVAAQPQPAPEVQTVQPSAPEKKKRSAGSRILSILIVLIVFFGVKYAVENSLFVQKSTSAPSSGSDIIEIKGPALTDSCIYGALYQDGYLTYGLARIHIPGYSLIPGEGEQGDLLMNSDGSSLFSVNKHIEIGISYDSSTAEGILESYTGDNGLTNVSMVDFRKYEVNGYPVLRYIVSCTADGMDQYLAELIVLPNANPSSSLRLSMNAFAANGQSAIDQVFDSLEVSGEFALTQEDTQTIGINRITMK